LAFEYDDVTTKKTTIETEKEGLASVNRPEDEPEVMTQMPMSSRRKNDTKRNSSSSSRSLVYSIFWVILVVFITLFLPSLIYIYNLIALENPITITSFDNNAHPSVHDVTAIILKKNDLQSRGSGDSHTNNIENKNMKKSTTATTKSTNTAMMNSSSSMDLGEVVYYNTNSTTSKSKSSSTDKFNNILLDCRKDSYCHLLYHHVPKTAGTLLAGLLHRVFNVDGKPYVSEEWCCYEVFMDNKFNNNGQEEYCSKRRISILELWGNEFQNVLEVCNNKHSLWNKKLEQNQNQQRRHRYVALVTTRHPIERTISLINYQCNGDGYESMAHNFTWQSYCRMCSYYNDEGGGTGTNSNSGAELFFDYFVNDTIKAYNGIAKYISLAKSSSSSSSTTVTSKSESEIQHDDNNNKIPILVLDTIQINNWIRSFDIVLNKRARDFHPQVITNWYEAIKVYKKNQKNVTICDFAAAAAAAAQNNNKDGQQQKQNNMNMDVDIIQNKLSSALSSYNDVIWNNNNINK
jgi:hypothetical protein